MGLLVTLKTKANLQTLAAIPGRNSELAVQSRRDGAHDRETKSASGSIVVSLKAIEPLEYSLPVGLGDARAVIFDFEQVEHAVLSYANRHRTISLIVADGVVDKVREQFSEQQRVCPHQDRVFARV